MRKQLLWLCAITALCMLGSCSRKLVLNDYLIVIPEHATQTETEASSELQRYFKAISGAQLRIVSDTSTPVEHEILVGLTNRLTYDSLERFGVDGFVIRTVGKKVAIYGGPRHGALYGVYTLLEEYFGCRKYTSKVEVIPKQEELSFPARVDNVQIPVITNRWAFVMAADSTFLNWHKMNQAPGNKMAEWGLFVHTFDVLLPPATYFKTHPEYYALVRGARATTQPCLSNPEVLEVVCENLTKEIAKNPEANYWSVSSNDNFGYCECDACRAIDAEEESPAGSVIRFVNKVAARFPDKVISTLGYHFTQKAPKTRPAKNVNIMFCSIECERNLPIAVDSSAKCTEFRRDMEDWAKLTDNILVWDYSGAFKVLQSPFPNLSVLQPNMQYFVKNNVSSMFILCTSLWCGELCELRTYLLGKLLWNPDVDIKAVTDDFLKGYYGAAAPHIQKYLDLLETRMHASGEPLKIYNYTIDYAHSWLSPEYMREYLTIFDQAEAAVANQPELLERVRILRQPINFSQLELSRVDPYGPEGFLEEVDGKWSVKPQWKAKLKEFVDVLNKEGAPLVCEWHSTPDQYLEQMLLMADVQQVGNLAYRKPVTASAVPAEKFTPKGQGLALLTDGLRGTELHVTQWLGFFNPSVDLDIDLGSAQRVQHIDSHHLQILWESAFLPEKVEVFTSLDGKTFSSAGIKTHVVTNEPFYGTKRYDFDFAPRDARFIRVRVNGLEKCPAWHYYAGNDALMFVDEIVVR